MKQNINIEAEKNEIIIRNEAEDYAIIPAKYRSEIQKMLEEGCHDCIDSLVDTLPVMDDYAHDGSLFPNGEEVEVYNGKDPKYDVKSIARRNGTTQLSYEKEPSTHRMSYAEVNGKYVVFPTLFQDKDKWVDLDATHNKVDKWAALDEAKRRGETFSFDDEKSASDFAAGSWKKNYTKYNTSSQEYRDLYNSGKLMNYDKETDTYSATPLKEVTITAKAPQWLKYKRDYEKTNPKSNYINSYLTPFAKALGNTETNYPKRLDDEYDNNLYSSYIDKLYNDFSFEFSDKEQEIVDKYSKTERDKSAYKYFKEKNQDKKWQDEYIEATKDITFDTFTDQLPDIAKKYQGNPYIDKILKLPHMNKLKSGYRFLYEGRPLTAISELIKIPKFSSIGTDALMNIIQDNPEGYDLKNIEDKYLSPVRLAGLKNQQVITDIGYEIINSGETKNSSWKLREYNLPDLETASKAFSKKYNTDQNDFVEFIENYMVGRNKTYKETLAAYEKYLRSQNQNKSEQ